MLQLHLQAVQLIAMSLVCVLICCLLQLCLTSLSASVTFTPPPLRYDISTASLWRCHHNLEQDAIWALLNQLPLEGGNQGGNIEITHSRQNWVEFLSSEITEEHLASLGLDHCHRSASLHELIGNEVQENPDILRYHASSDWLAGRGSGHQRLLRRSVEDGKEEEATIDTYTFNRYLNFTSMMDWYESLAAKHPSVVTLNRSIGQSHYHRNITAVHITHQPSLGSGSGERQKVFLQCLLHAREWITGPVCMYIAKNLAENSLYSDFLKHLEFIIVPVVNPDGYYVTWYEYPKYRLWRKNVQPVKGSKCAGVDLNRNFDSHWNEHSTSRNADPCNECYRGHAPNSELEVRAITSYLRSFGQSLIGAIDFHSYYQEVVYPPAYADVHPEGIEQIRSVSDAVAATISLVGATYASHRMVDLYSASGTFPDWLLDLRTSGEACSSLIPLTIELRPNSTTTNGFLLPQSQIYPTCVEILIGFTEFVERVLDLGKDCYSQQKHERP